MDAFYWENSPVPSDLSDLDAAWSPASNFVSDQENINFCGFFDTDFKPVTKKSKCPTKKFHQRHAANMRERRRMKTINDAFEGLRSRIPAHSNDRKLSKVDTLRLAIGYIRQLQDMVESCGSEANARSYESVAEEAKVIIRCTNIGVTEYTHETEQSPLYGHSLSWTDEKLPKLGPNSKLSAKVWVPEDPRSSEDGDVLL